MIVGLGNGARNVLDASRLRIQDFFAEVLGRDWSAFSPRSWLSGNVTWDDIGSFDIRSNLQDLIAPDAVPLFQRPQSLGDLYTRMDTVAEAFCETKPLKPPVKVPSTCYGPQILLTYHPKQCYIVSDTKQILCDPAKLVMYKIPGSCVVKYYTPFEWSGKECKHQVIVGQYTERVIGGGSYVVDLTAPISSTVERVREHVTPDPPFAVSTAYIPGQPLQMRVSWTPSDKATLQGVIKYEVKCAVGSGQQQNAEYTRTVKALHEVRTVIIGAGGPIGENRPLAPGQLYVCTVAGINVKGVGEPRTAPTARSFSSHLIPRYPATGTNYSSSYWRLDRNTAPARWSTTPITYAGRADVVKMGINSLPVPNLTDGCFDCTIGRINAVAGTNIGIGDSFIATASAFIPASFRDAVDPNDADTWRRFVLSIALYDPNDENNQGLFATAGFRNFPRSSETPVPGTNYAQFFYYNPYDPNAFINLQPISSPVRYDAWNSFVIQGKWTPNSNSLTFTYFINNQQVGTYTGDIADYNSACMGPGNVPVCTQVQLFVRGVFPCVGGSAPATGYCSPQTGMDNCCGATYDVYWSDLNVYSLDG